MLTPTVHPIEAPVYRPVFLDGPNKGAQTYTFTGAPPLVVRAILSEERVAEYNLMSRAGVIAYYRHARTFGEA